MIVCIDPGHGQDSRTDGVYDPGAVNKLLGAQEASIALEWAKTLKFILTKAGIPCFLTRDYDLDSCPLESRVKMASHRKATHFISIHCNSHTVISTGTETLYRGSPTIWAEDVQNAAMKALGLKNRGLKMRNNLAVLHAKNSCLLELGFINNPWDLARMRDRQRRIVFAEAIRDSLLS